MPNLSRTRFIAEIDCKTQTMNRTVPFVFLVDEEHETAGMHTIGFDKTVWDEMGSPQFITVSVEPGDKLNEDDTNVDYVRVYEDVAGDWRWAAIARNGKEVSSGQGHRDAHDAKRAANGVLGHDVEFREEN